MSDIEKGRATPTSMAPPPAYQPPRTTSFNPQYEHFVNVNLREHPDEQTTPVQAYDQIELPPNPQRKWPSKRRWITYLIIAVLLVAALATTLIVALRPKHDGNKRKAAVEAEAVTITETASPSPTSSISISVSVSVSRSLSISTLTSQTTKTTTATTTVATTAPTPSSILEGASKYWDLVRSSIADDLASGRAIQSAALTKYPGTTIAPSTTTTLLTTVTPPPETVVETTVIQATASTERKNVLCPEDVWFCR